MLWYLVLFLFVVCCFVLSWLSSSLVKTLIEVARYLRWREFIIAFFVMAFAASLPNLFVDLNAAFQHLPQIAFGDIIGGNLVDLTLAMAVIVFFSKKGVPTDSKMIQGSSIFTFLIAILPIFLLWTGKVTRADGVVLILAFLVYSYWLFSKDGRYQKVYEKTKKEKIGTLGHFVFFKNLAKLALIIIILLVASQGVIFAAKQFAVNFGISLSLVGILIVAAGNCFPETYFGIVSARRGEGWMVLGDMMGSVIVCATLVLGTIALISPFAVDNFSVFFIARIFTVVAALFFMIFIKTDRQLTKREGILLLFIYIIFLLTEIFVK